jgi:beta-alanine--pyruvate transaminase
MGLIAAIELSPRPNEPGARGFQVFLDCFEKGLLLRANGDTIALSPPLIIDRDQIDQLTQTLLEVLGKTT